MRNAVAKREVAYSMQRPCYGYVGNSQARRLHDGERCRHPVSAAVCHSPCPRRSVRRSGSVRFHRPPERGSAPRRSPTSICHHRMPRHRYDSVSRNRAGEETPEMFSYRAGAARHGRAPVTDRGVRETPSNFSCESAGRIGSSSSARRCFDTDAYHWRGELWEPQKSRWWSGMISGRADLDNVGYIKGR